MHKYRQYNVRITTLRGVRITIVVVEKVISITHSECVYLALLSQHAQRVGSTILSSLACPVLPHFFHIIMNRNILEKTVIIIQYSV